jgi:hypothetical protein
MRERLEDDVTFAIKVSKPRGNDKQDEENQYEDDLAVPPEVLAKSLAQVNVTDDFTDAIVAMDDNGNCVLRGGVDEELTDADADGETDSDVDMATDSEICHIRSRVEKRVELCAIEIASDERLLEGIAMEEPNDLRDEIGR